MAKRQRLEPEEGSMYFDNTGPRSETFSSGCTLLNCAMGGGWAKNRIVNLVGDKSTGKTLLAIEASANFVKKYKTGSVYYAETEAAFDTNYAQSLGLPMESVEMVEDCYTIEDVFERLAQVVEQHKDADAPALFVIDSLDALSDKAEQTRKIDDGSYGMTKQKKLGELFRRLVKPLQTSNVTILIISQIRDKIGVTFGKKTTRSGGRALDFYCSQIVWLAHIGQIQKTRRGQKRAVGVRVKAKVEKNKIAMPFREAEFPIYFTYGVEDLIASIEWLKSVKALNTAFGTEKAGLDALKRVPKMDNREYRETNKTTRKAVRKMWKELESEFLPTRRKY
jgi:recombination protein RecA